MKSYIVLTVLCISLLLLSAGCDRAGGEEGKSESPAVPAEKGGLHGMHDGWWCGEHGIVEKECAMCVIELRTECREKGDWCEKHTRPASQCFKCNPEFAEPYTKRYVARYGEQPPPWND